MDKQEPEGELQKRVHEPHFDVRSSRGNTIGLYEHIRDFLREKDLPVNVEWVWRWGEANGINWSTGEARLFICQNSPCDVVSRHAHQSHFYYHAICFKRHFADQEDLEYSYIHSVACSDDATCAYCHNELTEPPTGDVYQAALHVLLHLSEEQLDELVARAMKVRSTMTQNRFTDGMINEIRHMLKVYVERAIGVFLEEENLHENVDQLSIDLRHVKDGSFGDFNLPVMQWSTIVSRTSMYIATRLQIILRDYDIPIVEDIILAKPGYVNFRLKR